jgi:hypothetical protein
MKGLFWLSVLIFAVFTNLSFACTRFEFGVPTTAQFTRAEAVFIGQAIKVEDYLKTEGYLKVQFKVQKNFKGASNPTFAITTPNWRAACGLKIKKGQTWIIYAFYNEESKTFESSHGYRYNPTEDKEEVNILKAASERKTDTTISGRLISYGVYEYKYEPVEITVAGNGRQYSTTTKLDGTYKIPLSAPGIYKVKMKFPFRAMIEFGFSNKKTVYSEGVPTFFEYEIKLEQGDDDYSFFEVSKHNQ